MSDIPEVDLIAYAITETFGERCPDHEETCPCCKAWKQYDAIEARMAAAEQRGEERERERIAVALDDEAEATPCDEDAIVVRDCANLVRANFSYDEAEAAAIIGNRHGGLETAGRSPPGPTRLKRPELLRKVGGCTRTRTLDPLIKRKR